MYNTYQQSSGECDHRSVKFCGGRPWRSQQALTPCRSLHRRTKRLNNYTRKLRKTIKSNTSYLDKEYINRTDSSADCNAILRCMSTPVHCCRQILSIYHHIKTLISYHSTSYKWFHILRLQNVIVLYISKHLGSIYKGYIYMTTCVYLTK